jgi:c-di-GMP-binding flagellar brake protein YcgR
MSATVSAKNRRYAHRRRVQLDCQVVTERDFKLVARRSLDLSEDGMMVLADAEVTAGEQVFVSFRAPRRKTWIDAEATVVRVGKGRRVGDVGPTLGLAFDWIPERARALLTASMLGLPFHTPARVDKRELLDGLDLERLLDA